MGNSYVFHAPVVASDKYQHPTQKRNRVHIGQHRIGFKQLVAKSQNRFYFVQHLTTA